MSCRLASPAPKVRFFISAPPPPCLIIMCRMGHPEYHFYARETDSDFTSNNNGQYSKLGQLKFGSD